MLDQTEQKQKIENLIKRPPVVVIMGHVDHGKTSILDYIRKTRVVEKAARGEPRSIVEREAGGITQHIGAYEIEAKTEGGENKKITFIDTPGHGAFTKMRSRGAKVADIAVLVVAADEGFKTQTKEALKIIKEENLPFIVAANKMDKPNANIEMIKKACGENEIYIEEWGGETPFIPVSAKTGDGINDLIETIILLAELKNITANLDVLCSGVVIEARLDKRRGNTASLLVQNGVLKKGMFAASYGALASVKIMENFLGQPVETAFPSAPILIAGFNKLPEVGQFFQGFNSKEEAINWMKKSEKMKESLNKRREETESRALPTLSVNLVIKADTLGSLEAVEGEILKLQNENVKINILNKATGEITEEDIKLASAGNNLIVLGFNVKLSEHTKEIIKRFSVTVKIFDIIYKLSEWLQNEIENRAPIETKEELLGKIRILKIFKKDISKQILGGRVLTGKIIKGGYFRDQSNDSEKNEKKMAPYLGKILELEKNKVKSEEIKEGNEFGAMVETKKEIKEGDTLEIYEKSVLKKKIYQ